MPGRDTSQLSGHYPVKGRAKYPYMVTINYDTGHWCTCRGMLSKKTMWGVDAGRTKGTSCKHIGSTIDTYYGQDWGAPGGSGKPRIPNTGLELPAQDRNFASTPTTPAQPTGRRAAIMAQRAKRERETTVSKLSLLDRIDALAAAREGATG